MNLKDIRQQIFDQQDYAPDLANYRKSIDRRINNHYQELCSMANWLFLQKQSSFEIRKEVKGASPSIYVRVDNVTVSANIRKVYCFGFTPTLEMEGQTFTNTDSGKVFRIIRVVTNHFYIDQNWDGVADNATNIFTWSITFQRFALPTDCLEPLSFVSESDDWGEISFISQARADSLYLDKDSTGEPLVVVDDQFLFDDPPIGIFTVTNAGSSTGFTTGNKYEYCYTIYREGRESPPSLPVTFTVPTSGFTGITLSNLDNTGYWPAAAGGKKHSGMDKLIYRRDITNNGRWTLVGSVQSDTTTFVDAVFERQSTFAYKNNALFRFSNTTEKIPFDEATPRQNVTFWYVPSVDKSITFRYHYRPLDLVADTDTPVIPRQYHQALVYLTLQDMFLQMQDPTMAQMWEMRANKVLNAMRRRYLKRDAQSIRFGKWSKNRSNRRQFGDPVWNG